MHHDRMHHDRGTHRRLRHAAGAAALAALAVIAAACTPAPTSPTSTTVPSNGTAPVITTFTSSATTAPAPALIAFAWQVADPQGDRLTCDIDVGADGTSELTVPDCQGSRSRNLTIGDTGAYAIRFTVSDGTESATSTVGLSVTAGSSETFDIVLRPQTALSPEAQAAFSAAESRWEGIVTAGVPAVRATIGANGCGALNGAIDEVVDDLVIDISTTSIDGAGGVLARAGPCLISTGDGLPRFGVMEFDLADLPGLIASGTLTAVITHEMGHMLGIGTRWTDTKPGVFLAGGGTGDPRFTGPRAVAEWSALGGTGSVPVESTGGPGTADSHWRESTFGTEMMTGFVSGPVNPLSRLTIASLADLGYQVDINRADAYSVPSSGLLRSLSAAPDTELTVDRLGPVGSA